MPDHGNAFAFSIIVSVYNREKYIADCLNSLLSQKFKDFEIIVIDDGSTDKSGTIIGSFDYPNIRYFHKTHTGCWHSKNFGITKAGGKYLVYVDSDDYLSDNFLSTAFKLISTCPGYEYYYPERLTIVEKNGEVTPHFWQYFPYPENERWKLIHLFMNNSICGIPHTGAFVKRDVFERYGHFDQNLHNFGDVDYIIRRAEIINFRQLPGLRHYYKRNHENQICRHYSYRNQTLVNLMRYCLTHYPLSYYLSDYNKNSSIVHRRKFMCDRMEALLKTSPPPHTPFEDAMKDYLPTHR